jgi:hypothetical protein
MLASSLPTKPNQTNERVQRVGVRICVVQGSRLRDSKEYPKKKGDMSLSWKDVKKPVLGGAKKVTPCRLTRDLNIFCKLN